MTRTLYLLASVLVYPLALAYEGYCRHHERTAAHAKPRPPAVRASGRHTVPYVRRHEVTVRIGSQPAVEVTANA